MRPGRRWLVRAVAIFVLVPGTAPARGPSDSATGRQEVVGAVKPGEMRLVNGAVAYVPHVASPGPYPVIVMLHGASGYPLNFLDSMKPVAERRGAILLAPHSVGRTWDLIENAAAGRDPWSGRDTARLNESLKDLISRVPIDHSRIVLLGFSDGASYALSLGLLNPRTFKTVIALSPGTVIAPEHIDRAQQLFVAHGRSDHILPFDNSAHTLVPRLRSRGGTVTFRAFNGDHEIKRKVLDEALDLALGLQAPSKDPTSTPK